MHQLGKTAVNWGADAKQFIANMQVNLSLRES
jgi:ribosome-associated protein YbcJ (S4-like RNA binding protein)